MRRPLGTYLEERLMKRLHRYCRLTGQTKVYVINRAIGEFLEDKLKSLAQARKEAQ